jgi:hypothetical protein
MSGCHRAVKTFVALEWLKPGESEDTAALRLLRKIPARLDTQAWAAKRLPAGLHRAVGSAIGK